jgi:hypothetical protein
MEGVYQEVKFEMRNECLLYLNKKYLGYKIDIFSVFCNELETFSVRSGTNPRSANQGFRLGLKDRPGKSAILGRCAMAGA